MLRTLKPAETNPLTAEQEVQAAALAEQFLKRAQEEIGQMARLLARHPDGQLLGATEFQLRDLLHGLGAAFLGAALSERKQGGPKAPARAVRSAEGRPRASAGGPGRS